MGRREHGISTERNARAPRKQSFSRTAHEMERARTAEASFSYTAHEMESL